ncbi:MAG TPA: SPOR domain-containing protein [Desulfurivibrionaceae bacterium]|nr:SPOR domain-containing protein [Desulfurivibrionaceae bacterium]
MAAANGKKGFRLRFELSLSGLLGVMVVCFCIFLWMFLLGLWAGQTGLISGKSFSSRPAIPAAAKIGAAVNKVMETPELSPVPAEPASIPEPNSEPPGEVAPESAAAPLVEESAYYALQIGAFRDSRYVEEALRKWRAKGYEPFALPPGGADAHLTKVYLGRFPEVAAARKEAERLAKQEGIAPVVSLIPAGSAKRP